MAQMRGTIEVETPTDRFVLQGRPCEVSAFSYVPTDRSRVPPELTYYNVPRNNRYPLSVHDRTFYKDFGYNQYLHREDRFHSKARDLHIGEEEDCRYVPLLSSTVHGHRLPSDLDPPNRQHGRVELIKSEFYRNNGPNMAPEAEAGKLQKTI